jgi:DNA-binding transcriptional LysR family regulator
MNRLPFDIRQLEACLAVADELSFGQAAQRLHLSQSALSRQVARLEQDLGVRLFTRTTRQVQITSAGRLFLDEVRRLVAHGERAVTAARAGDSGMTDRLSIAFLESAGLAGLPRLMFELRRRRRSLMIDVRQLPNREIMQALTSEDVDIGFLRDPHLGPEFETWTFATDTFVALIPPSIPVPDDDPLELAALADHDCVLLSAAVSHSLYSTTLSACEASGFLPKVVQECLETFALLCHVAAGVGWSILPSSMTAISIPAVTYRAISSPATSSIVAVWSRDNHDLALRGMVDLMKAERPDT